MTRASGFWIPSLSQKRFCMRMYTRRHGVRERLKHKQFGAIEDHQLEAAAENSDNSPGY